jgi:hypothetical protein
LIFKIIVLFGYILFDTVSQSLGKASDLYSDRCYEMAHSLRQLTALSSDSRSFSMAKQGTIYCSSLAGGVAIPVSDYFKNDRKLSFSYGPVPAQKTQVINLKRQFRKVGSSPVFPVSISTMI